jgi:LysM repeat protein
MLVFAVHVVLLGGILLTACNHQTKPTDTPKETNADTALPPGPINPPGSDIASSTTTTTTVPPPVSNVTPPVNNVNPPGGIVPPAVSSTGPVAPVGPASALPSAPSATGASVYVIASGDLLSTIAKKNGVSIKALEEANPGIDPKKLQIGHKLQIPASTAVAATDASKPAAAGSDAAAADGTLYVVKTGDNLGKIAKAHGTTVKALEALNDMKTSAIKVGAKLKVPVMKVASVDAAAPAAPTPAPSNTAPASSVVPPSSTRVN